MRFAFQCGKFIDLQSRVRYIIVLAKGKTSQCRISTQRTKYETRELLDLNEIFAMNYGICVKYLYHNLMYIIVIRI